MITLKDVMGSDFTEGDRVAHGNSNGIRVGKVDCIKEIRKFGATWYKVFIDMSEHHNLTHNNGRMYVKRVGYEYEAKDFFKVDHEQV